MRSVALERRVGNQDCLGPGAGLARLFSTLPPGAWPTGPTGHRGLEDTALLDKAFTPWGRAKQKSALVETMGLSVEVAIVTCNLIAQVPSSLTKQQAACGLRCLIGKSTLAARA